MQLPRTDPDTRFEQLLQDLPPETAHRGVTAVVVWVRCAILPNSVCIPLAKTIALAGEH